jgi:hypothetical protein
VTATTKNGPRKILTFSIGLTMPHDGTLYNFECAVIKETCARAGGCTVSRNVGYWVAGGEYPDTRYTGPHKEERCFRLEVMCLGVTAPRIYRAIRACIQQEARRLGLDIDWVQVTVHDAVSLNFSVKEWMNR